MAISSIGVGSGLPLSELLDNLQSTLQSQRLAPLENRQKSVDARITAYGQLKSELNNVSNAAKALLQDAFDSMQVTVTGSDFTASAKTGSMTGNYTVKVNSLAKAQSLVTAGQASRTADIGTGGVISFTINGQTKQVDLSTTGTSLEDVAAAINSTEGLGVQATILNNGSGTPHQLVLSSKTTGTEAAVTNITVTGNDDLATVLNFGSAGSTVTESPAANASLEVNGVAVSSQSNTVSGVLDGVTLTLTGSSGSSNSMSISGDSKAVKDAIQTFVDRYNDVLKKIKQVTAFDVENQTSSALTGDSIARSIQSRLATVLNTTQSDGAFQMLSEIGIRTDPITGQLKVDNAVLDKALLEKPADVQALFRGENGVANRAIDVAKIFTDNTDGVLATATEGANRTRKDLERQLAAQEARIEAQMEAYRKQFSALDAMIAQMNSTSSYLAQQLSQLGTKNS